jgi:hypothetical protein
MTILYTSSPSTSTQFCLTLFQTRPIPWSYWRLPCPVKLLFLWPKWVSLGCDSHSHAVTILLLCLQLLGELFPGILWTTALRLGSCFFTGDKLGKWAPESFFCVFFFLIYKIVPVTWGSYSGRVKLANETWKWKTEIVTACNSLIRVVPLPKRTRNTYTFWGIC